MPGALEVLVVPVLPGGVGRVELLGGVGRVELLGGVGRVELLGGVGRVELLGGVGRVELLGGVGREELVPCTSSVIPGQASASVCRRKERGEERRGGERRGRYGCVDANSCQRYKLIERGH